MRVASFLVVSDRAGALHLLFARSCAVKCHSIRRRTAAGYKKIRRPQNLPRRMRVLMPCRNTIVLTFVALVASLYKCNVQEARVSLRFSHWLLPIESC